jgi:hypothetical protein
VISLTRVYEFQQYIKLMTLEKFAQLIPFMAFLNHIVTISCTWLLLVQNLLFPRDLDQVFRELSAIDRILKCDFHLKINYAGIRKNFHIVCFGVLLSFVLYTIITLWIVHDGTPVSVLRFVAQLNVLLICLLFGYICYNIILRMRLLQSFILKNNSWNVEPFQEIFQHFSNVVKISNQYFGLKFVLVLGNF